MTTDYEEWVLALYAEEVDAAGDDGLKKTDAALSVAENIASTIPDAEFESLRDELLLSFVTKVIGQHDDRSRNKQREHLEIVLAALDDETILGLDDPIFGLVTSVGGGLRKTWRHVNSEDIFAMVQAKTDHSKAAAIAAAEFTSIGHGVIRALQNKGTGATIEDLFQP